MGLRQFYEESKTIVQRRHGGCTFDAGRNLPSLSTYRIFKAGRKYVINSKLLPKAPVAWCVCLFLFFRYHARGYFPTNWQIDSPARVEGPAKPGCRLKFRGREIFCPRLRVCSQEFFSRSSRTITDRRLLPSLLSSCWYDGQYLYL